MFKKVDVPITIPSEFGQICGVDQEELAENMKELFAPGQLLHPRAAIRTDPCRLGSRSRPPAAAEMQPKYCVRACAFSVIRETAIQGCNGADDSSAAED